MAWTDKIPQSICIATAVVRDTHIAARRLVSYALALAAGLVIGAAGIVGLSALL